ncbi:MAG: tetraacyldisaccharide 4'-kinase [Hahellaceae bacterium]|nr:tetraacyldisaccharide 4'-kinase [Hahellaceae bacterium]
MSLARKIEQIWYEGSAWRWALVPLSLLYRAVVTFRRYRWLKRPGAAYRSRVPLIVIGNLTVGGTGKTPLTLACIALARALGLRPGVVSRGYGGKAPHYPCRVDQSPDAALVGDEPLLIWRNSACPVVVSPIRADAVALLESAFSPDIIFSDDGLQHYAMARQAEIVVVDGKRGYGNGWCLPAGPLRERCGAWLRWIWKSTTGLIRHMAQVCDLIWCLTSGSRFLHLSCVSQLPIFCRATLRTVLLSLGSAIRNVSLRPCIRWG